MFSSRVVIGIRRRDSRLLFCDQFDAEPDIILRVRGIDVSRYLAGLLRDRRHVPDESQVSSHAHLCFCKLRFTVASNRNLIVEVAFVACWI